MQNLRIGIGWNNSFWVAVCHRLHVPGVVHSHGISRQEEGEGHAGSIAGDG